MKLLLSVLIKLIAGFYAVAVRLFAPAGTFNFPGAWRLIPYIW